MIISRTPFRLSFFGGGTDFPSWYRENGGAVLATSIDKYCYLTCRYLPPFFEHRIRVVWSKIENCKSVDDISHPAVREVIRALGIDRYLEIHHVGDLPARSGVGSSSSFTIGLLHALLALSGRMLTKRELAQLGIHLEQEVLRESVGSQDQVSAAFGGFNRIDFHRDGSFTLTPITIREERLRTFQSRLLLFYTGVSRSSSEVSRTYSADIRAKAAQLNKLRELVDRAVSLLGSDKDLDEFGELLREGWETKRSLSANVSNEFVDSLFERSHRAGAIGGKLTGAGGGGFLLLYVPESKQEAVKEELRELLYVPFQFEQSGSQIIFADTDADYLHEEQNGREQFLKPFRELKISPEEG